MAKSITLLSLTDKGMQNIKDSPKRLDQAKELCRKFGAEITDFSLTMGQYDAVVTCEAPDDETAAKIVLAIASAGAVRSTTMRAFSEPEYREIIAALP